MKTFALGDPHGGYKAMLQCFARSGFDYERDTLICLGDVCDGWPEVRQCFDELLKVKHLKFILGNHDKWFLNWCLTGETPEIWTSQGGLATMESYERHRSLVPPEHIALLASAKLFIVDDLNRVFVHGGFNPASLINKQPEDVLLWDRDLLACARRKHLATQAGARDNKPVTRYAEVFVGHTTTSYYKSLEPQHFCEIYDLDTGGGFEGKLTLMNIDTHQYVQSDLVKELYPNARGRF